jgi:hypothetical protein
MQVRRAEYMVNDGLNGRWLSFNSKAITGTIAEKRAE